MEYRKNYNRKLIEDLYGNEVVMQVKDLSNENQLIILNQIQNGK